MKTIFFLLICLTSLILNVQATIINVPAEQSTIQAGINTALDGDTVLVQPGTYLENINFEGKNIVLGSLFLMTRDTNYISQTVIDGNHSGSVVIFANGEDSTATLIGFTIINGHATYGGGVSISSQSSPTIQYLDILDSERVGVYCAYSNPKFLNVRVEGNKDGGGMSFEFSNSELKKIIVNNNYGTGISNSNSNINLVNAEISNNTGPGFSCVAISSSNSSIINTNIYMNGNVRYIVGGGIDCGHKSNLYLKNVNISDNKAQTGGGVSIAISASAIFDSVIISNNFAKMYGGGIECSCQQPIFKNVQILENTCDVHGGGIKFSRSHPILENVKIARNHAMHGGGIYFAENSVPDFNYNNRCNIYHNTSSASGNDIYAENSYAIEVVVDTFTVATPTDYYAHPINSFSFDILNAKVQLIDADLYVSPTGNDENSGIISSEPLKKISTAFSKIYADSLHLKTIYLANGEYSNSKTGENFPIQMISYVSLAGDTENDVILNAEKQSNVITFDHDQGVEINNMTITGGDSAYAGGGILCTSSNHVLKNVSIVGNKANLRGGGICYYYSSNPILQDVKIISNEVHYDVEGGGGIYCYSSSPRLVNVSISNNVSYNGGGFFCQSTCNPSFESVNIIQNVAKSKGGGIFCYSRTNLNFHDTNRCNIYFNHAYVGQDLYATDLSNIEVKVDTFTVMHPTDLHAYPRSSFLFDINHAKIEQVAKDLYVSPEGENSNSGESPTEPLKNIWYALSKIVADSTSPHTINLKNGIFSYSATEEFFPVVMQDYISFIGQSQDSVILDAERQSKVLVLYDIDGAFIQGLTIRGGFGYQGSGIRCENSELKIVDVTICDNIAEAYGGGIQSVGSDLILENVKITNNTANYGGGIYLEENLHSDFNKTKIMNNTALNDGGGIYFFESDLELTDNIIQENVANGSGGGIYYSNSNLTSKNMLLIKNVALEQAGGIKAIAFSNTSLINSTISGNKVELQAGGIFISDSKFTIINSILNDNLPHEVYFEDNFEVDSMIVAYSNVQGGMDSIITDSINSIYWLEGNIDANPLFVDTTHANYHLADNSPCVGGGIDSIQINNFWYYAPFRDIEGNTRPYPVGTRPDMGAFENELGFPTDINGQEDQLPKHFALYQNYPNPFNPETCIIYHLCKDTNVKIKVYNMRGQLVRTLVNKKQQAGRYSIFWDGKDFLGEDVASGIYICQMTTAGFVKAKKLTLIR